MAEQHKSGPWVYEDYSMDGKLFVVPGDYIGTICSIEARGGQSVANARLIAAAPELLEALERMVDSVPFGDEPEYAIKAIAKAKGKA